jgi:hypothetical protein
MLRRVRLPRDEHLIMPKDTAVTVEMTQGMLSRLYLLVARGGSDDVYFAPLSDLRLPSVIARGSMPRARRVPQR